MKLKAPPKRINRSIPLDERENSRFLKVVRDMGHLGRIEQFLTSTSMYLRGRCDGTSNSNTEACGYIFLNNDSFQKWHRQIAYFDPFPETGPLKLSFRKWNQILPFSEDIWHNRLDADDKCQHNMRVKLIHNNADLQEAIALAEMVRNCFSSRFNLTIDRK